MFFRIIALFGALLPIGWGVASIFSGNSTDRFGPVLGGLMFLSFGLLWAIAALVEFSEQNKNDNRKD